MEKCKETMKFGDDYGDNDCTFHCQLEKDHEGNHRETGNLYGEEYVLEWHAESVISRQCPMCEEDIVGTKEDFDQHVFDCASDVGLTDADLETG